MDANRPLGNSLSLVPLDDAPPKGDDARPAAEQSAAVAPSRRESPVVAANEPVAGEPPQRPARAPAKDFLSRAAKEYQEGRIDEDLWDRTAAQFDGNEPLMLAAYLRLRARALRRAARDERDQPPGTEDPARDANGAARSVIGVRLMVVVAALALAGSIGLVWYFASPRTVESPPPPVRNPAASPKMLAAAQAAAKPANEAPSPGKALEAKVQELEKAGNWNVMVIYAGEWTRKEPGNADAWTQLSTGYGKLRQLGDALDAATKAVQLAPEDSRHWRNLGRVYLALERFAEARSAFDKVLAASAEDADALCGTALVAAGEGRMKDAEAVAARLKAAGGNCDLTGDTVSVAIAPGGSGRRSVPARSR